MPAQLSLEPSDPRHLFEVWAPIESRWSAWAKPVLFTQLGGITNHGTQLDDPQAEDVSWLDGANQAAALVVDLPGSQSVRWGVAATGYGYWPVPLFNTSRGSRPVIDLRDILAALATAEEPLRQRRCTTSCRPAFLLDRGRLAPSIKREPGVFDNRWIVFPQDFPSGEYLLSQGCEVAIVVRQEAKAVSDDLIEVLRRWRKAGMRLEEKLVDSARLPSPIRLPRWRPRRLFWWLAGRTLGLRGNSAGGFGGTIPLPRSG